MPGLGVQNWPAVALAAAFFASAVLVWLGGSRMSRYAAEIGDRTGAQRALLGVLLLGFVTSLPEVTTVVTATTRGSEDLALNNLLGGVALQVVILVFADVAAGNRPLSSIVAQPVVLLIGVLEIALLTIAAAGILLGDVDVFGVGATSLLLTLLFVPAMMLVRSIPPDRQPWTPRVQRDGEKQRQATSPAQHETRSAFNLAALTVAAAIAVLIGGFVLTLASESIAERTGLGRSFIGVTLVAMVTSLPELSATVTAARMGEYELAFSNVFGSNLFLLALVLLVDILSGGPPALSTATTLSLFSLLLGIMVTAVYLAGLVERADRRIWRIGYDSLAVLVLYLGGLVVMYRLR